MPDASNAIRIDGLKELIRNLERLGTEASDLKAGFRRVGSLITKEAQSLTPHRSGALAASIRPSNTKNKSTIRAGKASIRYAGPIHFGWPAHGIEAQPFLYDAIDNVGGEAVELMNDELRGAIRRLGL